MRIVILAAGQGKRLLPLTTEVPKALLDIGGKTLIERQIEAFAAAGIKDFTVVTGYGASRMEEALAKIGSRLGVCCNRFIRHTSTIRNNCRLSVAWTLGFVA